MQEVGGPGRGGALGRAETEAVRAIFVDAQGKRHAGAAEGGGEEQAIFDRHGTILDGMPEEAGRSVGGDARFGRQGGDKVCGRIFTEEVRTRAGVGMRRLESDDGIAENTEVGPGTLPLDGIGGVGAAGIVLCDDGCGEVAASGGTDDPDAGGIESLRASEMTGEADGAGSIVQHGGMFVAVRSDAVVQYIGRDAVAREPAGVAFALMRGEKPVTAAGEDDDGRAGPLGGIGQEGSEQRGINRSVAEGARRALWPETVRGSGESHAHEARQARGGVQVGLLSG